ncbi:MAG: DUF6199 family natural product biosynthesis protein [Faecousia sp.]
MKQLYVLLLIVSVLLCGCSGKLSSGERTVIREGTEYIIDTEKGTITEGGDVYWFSVERNRVTITYPDGGTYAWEKDGGVGYGSVSADYDGSRYVSGSVLAEVLAEVPLRDTGTDIGMVIGGLACLVIGLWSALFPQTVQYLRHGWRYRDAEPSDMALTVTRLGGILASILGAIVFLAGL